MRILDIALRCGLRRRFVAATARHWQTNPLEAA
ncbi:hypothetical protein AWB73_01657 [Caballeronia turbans]|jgi:hypothetical protein|nr:hypothetical protein AWB73_01657 [Caballeronia turbans]